MMKILHSTAGLTECIFLELNICLLTQWHHIKYCHQSWCAHDTFCQYPWHILWFSKRICSILWITCPFGMCRRKKSFIHAFMAVNVPCSFGSSKRSRHCGCVVMFYMFSHVVQIKIKTVSVDKGFTHLPLVPHIYISELGRPWFR